MPIGLERVIKPMERKKRSVLPSKLRLRSIDDLDGRTTAARSAQELRKALSNDLGGPDSLSAMQLAILDNVCLLGAALGHLAASYLAGEGADLALYATLSNSQRRLLADLGLERRAKDITPPLRDYVRKQAS